VNEIKINETVENLKEELTQLAKPYSFKRGKLFYSQMPGANNMLDEDYTISIEYKNGLTISQYINNYGVLPELECKYVIKEALIGLDAFQNIGGAGRKLAHRDIKHDNIIFEKKDGQYKAMLVDFGVAQIIDEAEEAVTDVGTHGFKAPEVTTGNGYDFRSDYWSIGIVLYYAKFGSNWNIGFNEVYGISKTVPASIEFYSFLERCLQEDPEKRFLSVQEMQDHPFLKCDTVSGVYLSSKALLSVKKITIRHLNEILKAHELQKIIK
jgi:serine/threonine protein kinase